MSRKRQNNHYHYAEKFTDRGRRAKRFAMPLPRRAVFFALLILILFGTITVTFSTTNTGTAEDSTSNNGAILVRLRNQRVNQGLTPTGAEAYAVTGANADLASTSASTYYYRGGDNSWGATAMTVSSDGFYAYIQSSNNTNQFKISTSTSSYDYNYTYVSKGFNSTNVTNIGDYSKDNCYCWQSGTYYILVYYPNTIVNSSSNPKICASTTLPASYPTVKLGEKFSSSGDTYHTLTRSSGFAYSGTVDLTGGQTKKFFFKVSYGNNEETYKDQNGATMTYDHCTDWTFEQNSGSDPQLETVTTGTYTFSFNYSTKKVSVVYAPYQVTLSKSPSAGSTGSLTPSSTTSVAVGSGITISAPTAATGYEWVNWTVTKGAVKTGSYASGTAMTSNTTRTSLTVYPYGTNTTVNLQANYKLQEFAITYNDGSGSPVSGSITNPSAPNSVPTGDTKQYNVDYTITSNTYSRTGYTQVGWATTKNYTRKSGNGTTDYYALGANYAENKALTLYPVWELNAPKNAAETGKPTISGGTIVAGQTFDIDPSMNDCPADATRSYSYTITRGGNDATSYASIGTDSSNAATYHVFSTSTPGAYSVTWTVTDTNEDNGVVNANCKASATTDSVTINVLPVSPILQWTIFGTTGRDDTHDGTSEYPFMIMLGNQYYCTVTVTNANANYTYTWYTDSEFTQQLGTGTSITFNGDYVTSTTAGYAPSTAEVASDSESTPSFTVYCRASCNGKDNDSLASTVYYIIQPLVEDFHFLPFQKVFGLADSSVSLAAQYNLEAADGYTTELMFSSTNETDSYVVAQTVTSQFMKVFETAIRQFMYPAGPKYFYMRISGTVNDVAVSTVSPKIHTTVGTANSTATRPIYFYNNSGFDLKNYQVICYYIDANGNLGYNAAQDMKKGGSTSDDGLQFRAMIPEGATAVRFGFLNVDPKYSLLHYYGMPTLSEGTISGMSKPIFIGCTTQVALNDTTRRITSAEKTESDGFYTLSCTSSVY